MYKSNGINYTFIDKNAPPNFRCFGYILKHVPTGDEFTRTIWCKDKESCISLLSHFDVLGRGKWEHTFVM